MSDLTAEKSREELSLENCDSEPVHIPGHIQDFAILLATDKTLSEITHCSANASKVFGKPAKEIVGSMLSDLLDANIVHDLNNTLGLASARIQRERVTEIIVSEQTYEIWAHVSEDYPVIEFEPIHHEALNQNQSILNVRSLLSRLNQDQDIDKSLNAAVTGLRLLSGYDRVLAYVFDKNGDGEIKAEARGPELQPFLGLRFPKWDIPKQARAIMKTLPLRVISNVNGTPVPLLTDKPDRHPLNITLAASRGVSPIHMEYLRNMGVRGSMTLTIVIGGELWGLFAFHHSEPRNIGPGLRSAAELFVHFFSLQMEQRITSQMNKSRADTLEYQSMLLNAVDRAINFSDLIAEIASPLCDLVDADGLAVISGDTFYRHGQTPPKEMIQDINNRLLKSEETDFVVTDSLLEYDFKAAPSAGAMALRLDKDTQNTLVFFRNEAAMSVKWAGAPIKTIIEDETGLRLSPRGSFEVYKESISGKSRPWEKQHLLSAKQAQIALTKADNALLRRLSHQVERQRNLYVAEFNHRVRNILSLVRSLSRRTQQTTQSVGDYAEALERRINALGAAHDLAANRVGSGIVIHELFELEAKAFRTSENNQFVLKGERFVLASDAAPIFALIVHELMINAVKHGALSVTAGKVMIDIQEANDGIDIIWTETGGPKTSQPSRKGFGMELIQSAAPYELEGTSEIEFRPQGLRAKFWLPMNLVKPLPQILITKPEIPAHDITSQNQVPEKVLIVEDSLMLAIDMSDMLNQIGVRDVEKCATIRQAKRSLSSYRPDMAVLDISLRNDQSFKIAYILKEKNIPFCFATGYGSEFPIPADLKNQLVLTKPVDINILRSAIQTLYP